MPGSQTLSEYVMSSKLSCHFLLSATRPSKLAGSVPIKGEWYVTPGQIRGFWASMSSVLNNSKYFLAVAKFSSYFGLVSLGVVSHEKMKATTNNNINYFFIVIFLRLYPNIRF